MKRLADELGDEELRHLFAYAHGLYRNYYVDAVPIEYLEYQIGKVKDLLALLDLVE